jgi:imidazolonepropionase-like amidohydrolase
MERLVLVGALLVDGTDAPPAEGRAVVVEGAKIAAVVDERAAPAGERIRLEGLTLLPGLINAHVHLCLGAEADPARVMRDEPFATTVLKAAARARQTVEAGVTTVRDLGGRDYAEIAVRDAVRAGLLPGPRILAAGKAICMTGGHGWWIGREADGSVDARRAVREQLKAGADVIKLVATGGVMTPGVEPGAPQLEPDEIRAAIAEAGKAGRRVAAHAQGTEGIAACVEAGITSIEHGIFLTEALVARMARDGVALVATLAAPERIAAHADLVPEFMARKSRAVMERHTESFRMALRGGVPVAAGSDAGTPFNPHGSLVPELALMVKAGMRPADAVRAATSAAASVLGLGDRAGRIAPGFSADLLAVPGDPTHRIEALGEPRLVMLEGKLVVNRLTSKGSEEALP